MATSGQPTRQRLKLDLLEFIGVYKKAFKRCDYKFKIGALRILLSENTFAGHWDEIIIICWMATSGQRATNQAETLT